MEVLDGVGGVLPVLDKFIPKSYRGSNKLWYVMPIATPLWYAIDLSDEKVVVDSICSVASTVVEMHGIGMSHRDIKPSNLLHHKGVPCLADFGLVTYPGKIEITESQIKIGARNTIAPEMRHYVTGSDGKAADVYSLAKTLWMFLCKQKKCFDGQYNPRSSISLRSMNPVAQIDMLDQLLEASTDHNPMSRPSIKEFHKALSDCSSIISDPDRLSKTKWVGIQSYLFPEHVPQRTEWSDMRTISDILNMVGESARDNHMFFPDGGGMDLTGASLSTDLNLIELFYDSTRMGSFAIRPKRLLYESFADSDWNYFRVEFENAEPSGVYWNIWPDDVNSEEVIELAGGQLVPGECREYGEWNGEPLPVDYRVQTRFRTGAIVVVHRKSAYNKDSSTYDGRHDEMNADEFRKYMARNFEQTMRTSSPSSAQPEY